jgi:prepilin-type N-terminal cleavage/methylation domain-containing protein
VNINLRREEGFTLTEMMVAMAVMLIVVGGALTTFQNAMQVNDSASQLADANQNLRAGTNQLIRDLMMAGRIIGAEGVSMPSGAGVQAFRRPAPPGTSLTFDVIVDADTTKNLPSLSTGYQKGPSVNGMSTDTVTLLTVDQFMPFITTPAAAPAAPGDKEGTISADGSSVLLSATSKWLVADTVADTQPIQVGDLIFLKGPNGNALQTVTKTDSTHIYFETGSTNDWFHFNQNAAPVRPIAILKGTTDTSSAWPSTAKVTLFKAMMITYYVDNTTQSGTPRLTRVLNHCPSDANTCPGSPFDPQALAGVVEDLDLSYDLVDGDVNPTNVASLPYTVVNGGTTVVYTSNQVRKVNIHVGVRSEVFSKPAMDYVRNHITTAVDVRSLASVDRYQADTK